MTGGFDFRDMLGGASAWLSDDEEWRTIAAAPNYAVSNHGRVKRTASGPGTCAGRMKKPSVNVYGYLVVNLVTEGKRRVHAVHRLVCIAFHGDPPSPKHEAAHWDGDKNNARADNLRWVLSLENAADRVRHGRNLTRGKVLSDEQVAAIRRDPRPQKLVASDFGISRMHVSRIKTGARRG